MAPKSILITGANRGIGLGLLKHFLKVQDIKIIIATCRDPSKAEELNNLKDPRLHILPLDIDSDDSISKLYTEVEKLVGEDGLTVLLNNAGILLPYDVEGEKSRHTMLRQIETNAVSTGIITQEFLPLLKKAAAENGGEGFSINRAAIVNISSTAASVERIDGTFNGPLVAYRMSKSALNSFAKSCSIDLAKYHILVTSFCPGWVKTDMGGQNALLEIDDATKKLAGNILTLGDAHHGAYLNADLNVIPN
uniref:NAD(P)-binding protein n=1 Tax=Caenorhabditis tropicalis TaxID=1561998 RepID=A0A1I7U282_9PELO